MEGCREVATVSPYNKYGRKGTLTTPPEIYPLLCLTLLVISQRSFSANAFTKERRRLLLASLWPPILCRRRGTCLRGLQPRNPEQEYRINKENWIRIIWLIRWIRLIWLIQIRRTEREICGKFILFRSLLVHVPFLIKTTSLHGQNQFIFVRILLM